MGVANGNLDLKITFSYIEIRELFSNGIDNYVFLFKVYNFQFGAILYFDLGNFNLECDIV
jgi:hypothetical protein